MDDVCTRLKREGGGCFCFRLLALHYRLSLVIGEQATRIAPATTSL